MRHEGTDAVYTGRRVHSGVAAAVLDDVVLTAVAGDLGGVRRARADEAAVAVEQRAREVVAAAVAELERKAVEAERLAARAVDERPKEAGVRARRLAVDPVEKPSVSQ